MALIDDINALPTTVGDGQTGHLQNHAIIHAALKDHEARIGTHDITGTGTPEGRIAATVGTAYTDTTATNGAIRWIKTSGTGPTGWKVEYGDTGLRLLTNAAIATGQIFFRRRNAQCDLYFKSCEFNTISASRISIPQSRSDAAVSLPVYSGIAPRQSSLVMTMTLEPTDIGHAMQPVAANEAFDARVSWSTASNWPTALPGTPA